MQRALSPVRRDARYTAHVGLDVTGETSVIVRRAVPAGIDGPTGQELHKPADMAEVDAWLVAQGYVRVGDWTPRLCYDGVRLECALGHL